MAVERVGPGAPAEGPVDCPPGSEPARALTAAVQEVGTAAPRWVAPVFGAGALLLLPWIVYLGWALPSRNLSTRWDLTWIGFDALLLFALARTAWFAWRGDRRVEMPAAATATLLLVDAWFDVTTSAPGWPMVQALLLALLAELPLAALALYINVHVEAVMARAGRRLREQADRLAAAEGAAGGPVRRR